MKKIFNFHNFFWGITIAIGIGYLVNGAITLQNARVSSGWPSVNGEVTASSIRTETTDDGTVYIADIEYRFVANDQWWEGDVVNFGENGSYARSDAVEILERYPIGLEVTVSYDPAMPETSVLEPGVTSDSYLFLIIGLTILVLVVFINGYPKIGKIFKK